MSRYLCWNCGSELDGMELESVEEYRGEFWGAPCYETEYVCPHCGSDDLEEIYEPDEGEK